jgi:hypothetical protein
MLQVTELMLLRPRSGAEIIARRLYGAAMCAVWRFGRRADNRAVMEPRLRSAMLTVAGALPVMVGVTAIALRTDALFAVAGVLAVLYVPAALVLTD